MAGGTEGGDVRKPSINGTTAAGATTKPAANGANNGGSGVRQLKLNGHCGFDS